MSLFHEPRISKQGRNTQASYDLPHRVYCTKVYPIKARNGSTIILYGHKNGLRILWRGGAPLKPDATAKDDQAQGQVDGGEPSEDVAREQQAEGWESLQRLPSVVQDMELSFGTAVLKIALPLLPAHLRIGSTAPNIFEKNMIIAIACEDASVKVISIPLKAPSAETKQKLNKLSPEKYAAIAQLPAGPKTHRSPAMHVALTWTTRDSVQPPASDQEEDTDWDLLLASAGPDVSGQLLITRIPLATSKGCSILRSGSHLPLQKLPLSSKAVSVAFNTSVFPSKRHRQLLIAERSGIVRVYDPLGSSSSHPHLGSDADSAMSLYESPKGLWISTFEMPYRLVSSTITDSACPGLARRKPILAAQWAVQGHSIVVLTSDGDFGLWALGNKERHASNELRASGGILSSIPTISSAATASNNRVSQSGLAPMTPNTRAAKAERLFSAPSPAASSVTPQGGLNVMTRSNDGTDESVIIWYGGDIFSISSLQALSKRSREESSSSGSLYGPGLLRMDGPNLKGELITSVAQLPFADSSRNSHSQPDIVVSTDSRLILLTKQAAGSAVRDSNALVLGDEDEEMEDEEMDRSDMELLRREELGLAGVDRLADSMSGSRLFGRSTGRKVLFAAS